MPHPGFALCVVLLAGMIGSASTAVAQEPPPCAPDATNGVTLTTQERSDDAKPIATHPVTVQADVDGEAEDVTVAPPPGATVFAGGKGDGGAYFIVPAAPSMAMTVTWRQPLEPEGQCSAARVITLPVLATRRSHTVRTPGPRYGASVAVLPALERPDLSPLEISVAVVSRPRLPPPSVRPRKMVVPLRAEDKAKYNKRLPSLSFIKTPTLCRFFFLTCGTVTTKVAALEIDDEALGRGIVRGDPDGSVSLLARTQPALRAARYGLHVDAVPAKNKIYGVDLQIRQSGQLLGRVRRAGRCRSGRGPTGTTYRCTLTRSKTKLG
jgi:hypothetical protein